VFINEGGEMKRLVLTVALVALLVAAVFGGQALASSKSNDISISEETSSILSSSYWGYPLRMKTLSGTAVIDGEAGVTILDETYSGVRHVSLTVFIWGLNSGSPAPDWVKPTTYIPSVGYDLIIESRQTVTEIQTLYNNIYEFDTDNWKLQASDYSGLPLEVYYQATITYPSNQW
jgi:hypothetical protein